MLLLQLLDTLGLYNMFSTIETIDYDNLFSILVKYVEIYGNIFVLFNDIINNG